MWFTYANNGNFLNAVDEASGLVLGILGRHSEFADTSFDPTEVVGKRLERQLVTLNLCKISTKARREGLLIIAGSILYFRPGVRHHGIILLRRVSIKRAMKVCLTESPCSSSECAYIRNCMYLRPTHCLIRKLSSPKSRLPGNYKEPEPQPLTTALSETGISDMV